jgi:hypothetical protein
MRCKDHSTDKGPEVGRCSHCQGSILSKVSLRFGVAICTVCGSQFRTHVLCPYELTAVTMAKLNGEPRANPNWIAVGTPNAPQVGSTAIVGTVY